MRKALRPKNFCITSSGYCNDLRYLVSRGNSDISTISSGGSVNPSKSVPIPTQSEEPTDRIWSMVCSIYLSPRPVSVGEFH